MKRTDIERIFTETVSSYIAQGYILNPVSMSGSQGEIAKVDLYKGDDFIRVMLAEQTGFRSYNYIRLSVLCGNVKPQTPYNPFSTMCATIWHDDLNVVEIHDYFWVGEESKSTDYYVENLEEALAANQKHRERAMRKFSSRATDTLYGSKATAIAIAYVKRKTGARCVDKRRLEVKTRVREDGGLRYIINYGAKSFILH